jgi:hypothetical protein
MAKGAVAELMESALDKSVSVVDLLRRCLVVAQRLSIADATSWVRSEMNGYTSSDVPGYRRVRGQLKGWNQFHGWQPVIFRDVAVGSVFQRTPLTLSVSEFESLLSRQAEGDEVMLHLGDELGAAIARGTGVETQYGIGLSRHTLQACLDGVRTRVLDWALELEGGGVHGDSIGFSQQEKQAAAAVQGNVNNFFGPVGSPTIQQGSTASTVDASVSIEVAQAVPAAEPKKGFLAKLWTWATDHWVKGLAIFLAAIVGGAIERSCGW